MRSILRGIETNGKEGDEDYSPVVENINRLQRGGGEPAPAPAAKPASAPAPTTAAPAASAARPAAPMPTPTPTAAPAAAKPAATAPARTASAAPAHPPAAPEPAGDQRAHNVSDSYLRVDVGLLDKLMNLVGELVLARNQILQFTARAERHGLPQRRRSGST